MDYHSLIKQYPQLGGRGARLLANSPYKTMEEVIKAMDRSSNDHVFLRIPYIGRATLNHVKNVVREIKKARQATEVDVAVARAHASFLQHLRLHAAREIAQPGRMDIKLSVWSDELDEDTQALWIVADEEVYRCITDHVDITCYEFTCLTGGEDIVLPLMKQS